MGTEFNAEQFDAIYPKGIENHYWTYARNKILAHTLKNNSTAILEVGCGKGVVVNYLVNKNMKITGVELASIPIDDDLKKNVLTGVDVFELDTDYTYKNIETILLLDVIEHIQKPKEFLKKLHLKFPALKQFIITVPACQELFSNYDEFNGHFRRYSIQNLENEFLDFKIQKIQTQYFFHLLYFPAKILLNTKGKRSEKIIAPSTGLQKLIHKLIGTFFYFEYLFFPNKLKGTSLLLKVTLQTN